MTALTQRATQLAHAAANHQSACDCCHDSEGEWLDSLAADMGDMEIVNLLDASGASDAILEAAVYAVRNQDFGYLVRQYERQAGPVIQKAARDEAERLGERP